MTCNFCVWQRLIAEHGEDNVRLVPHPNPGMVCLDGRVVVGEDGKLTLPRWLAVEVKDRHGEWHDDGKGFMRLSAECVC